MALFVPLITCILLLFFLIFTTQGRGILHWLRSLGTSDVEATGAKFSDFVSFAGFGLTIAGILLSWYTVSLESQKANVESQVKDLTDQNISEQQKLHELANKEQGDFVPDVDVHLEYPTHDVSLISARFPEIQWRYSRHNERLNYVVNFIKVDDKTLPESNRITKTCDFSRFRSCLFYASDPNSQRSKVPSDSSDQRGQFLWRVIPAKSSADRADDLTMNPVSEWSEYASFYVYPNVLSRFSASAPTAIVGTTSSDNVRFSTLDAEGSSSGHDIDLIRVLLEGCVSLSSDGSEIHYDSAACNTAASAYTSYSIPVYESSHRGLHVRIKSFPSVDSGLAALTRKQIDVFIGSVTKAVERENDKVLFTDGYYRFKSALYVHSLRGSEDLFHWARGPRSLGVVKNSTNHWLASALASDSRFETKLSVVAFSSYSMLREAFERQDVDGVLIDSVLGGDLPDATVVSGLEKTAAWNDYLNRIGYEAEEFAIAVADDPHHQDDNVWHSFRSYFRRWFNLPDTSEDNDSLYDPLQHALRSVAIQELLPELRRRNGLPTDDLQKGSPPARP